MFVFLALSSTAHAVSPPPDGGYAGGNTAEGQNALFSLTTGGYNTAVGFNSLKGDTAGELNTGVGAGTLFANTGDGNTAMGAAALVSNTSGYGNTANGVVALFSNTEGGFNTALGGNALLTNSTGTANTAIGYGALASLTAGNFNIALGLNAGSNVHTASNVICIRSDGANVSDTCFIGNIFGVATGGIPTPVVVDSGGQLGTQSSSRRFKTQIKAMDTASESILALKPVTFHYKTDKAGTPQFGLIAEEVAEVNPDLVVRDKSGELYTVRYDAVNAMLLNEFLKQHKKVEEQQKQIEKLTAQMNEQAEQIRKVNEKVEMTRPAPQMALGNQ
jgi:hypothetical protein